MYGVKQDGLPASGLSYLTDAPSKYIKTDLTRGNPFENYFSRGVPPMAVLI